MCNSTSDRQKKSHSVLLVNVPFAPVPVYTKSSYKKTQLKNNVNTS